MSNEPRRTNPPLVSRNPGSAGEPSCLSAWLPCLFGHRSDQATAGNQRPRPRRRSTRNKPAHPVQHQSFSAEDDGFAYNRPRVEDDVSVGDHVICRRRTAWIGFPYTYGQVIRSDPIEVVDSRGNLHYSEEFAWIMKSTDDGWLAPFDLNWQQPGRYVLIQLLSREWVSAKVAQRHKTQPIKQGQLTLELEGVDSLDNVIIEEEVAFIFVPHDECQQEFGHATPFRGGWLSDHINSAFKLEPPQNGETQEDAEHRQRLRWVEKSRTDGQYPIRSVWVHPMIKEGALNEFARRAHEKKMECPYPIKPEVVMLLGPPAAGKSSISRLTADQVSAGLVRTAQSLKYREEVNNDNLTDCMPGFSAEYKHVLAIKDKRKRSAKMLWKKASLGVHGAILQTDLSSRLQWIQLLREENLSAELWALQWLTYLVYHHGPVRDSLALDIIKVTVVDAHDLPVYYSSCMAGKAMGRAMMILDLSHDKKRPVPHKAIPFRGFWPFTSQEARFDRQEGRAKKEKEEGKLLGGNLTSNLVDIHYHAQQAETNITKLLGSLRLGLKATDDSSDDSDADLLGPEQSFMLGQNANGGTKTDVKVDHFLVIDNEGMEPKVLMDFASEDGKLDNENIQAELRYAVEQVITMSRLFVKEWDAFDPYLYRVTYYFVKVCFKKDDELRIQAKQLKDKVKIMEGLSWPRSPSEVLPMVTEIDEEVFFRKYGKRSTATDTDQYRKNEHVDDAAVKDALDKLSNEHIDALKKHLSVMRKYTCLAIMQQIKQEGDWIDELVDHGDRQFRAETQPAAS